MLEEMARWGRTLGETEGKMIEVEKAKKKKKPEF